LITPASASVPTARIAISPIISRIVSIPTVASSLSWVFMPMPLMDDALNITGTALPIDGGFTAQ
jgi:hypothetical protein